MIPLVGVPKSIAEYLEQYRELFKRKKGFEIVSRFITGLILSQNKTLESIHSQQFWSEVKGRNGKTKSFWAFTKVVRLKKHGKKRLVIA